MDLTPSDSVSTMDRVKIQAQVLLPLARRLREELGRERSDALLRGAIEEALREQIRQRAAKLEGSPLEKFRALMGDSARDNGPQLELEMHEMTPEVVRFDIKGCRYAELFQALGETGLGKMLLCDGDAYMAEVGGEAVQFSRSQTRMEGASHCDFCYRLRPESG